MTEKEKRVAVIYITEDELITVLNWWADPIGSWIRISSRKIPEDVEVLRVWPESSRRALGVLLYHKSFKEVKSTSAPPIIETNDFFILAKEEVK